MRCWLQKTTRHWKQNRNCVPLMCILVKMSGSSEKIRRYKRAPEGLCSTSGWTDHRAAQLAESPDSKVLSEELLFQTSIHFYNLFPQSCSDKMMTLIYGPWLSLLVTDLSLKSPMSEKHLYEDHFWKTRTFRVSLSFSSLTT